VVREVNRIRLYMVKNSSVGAVTELKIGPLERMLGEYPKTVKGNLGKLHSLEKIGGVIN
jgi:hypothetical protein